jgi:hypothetical protein
VTDERRRRVEHNEVVFRKANERLREDWRRLGMGADDIGLFLCECGDVTCKDPLKVRLDDYATVRADDGAFFVVPGHEDETVESVVDDLDVAANGFLVVRKWADAKT